MKNNSAGVRVSFIVLSWNSGTTLEGCVRSLLRQATNGERDEIWVIDNGSIDGTRDSLRLLADDFPETVKPILLGRNYGTTVSRNIAFRSARGRYIAVIDSDVFVPDGAISRLISRLEECGPALIAPRLVYPTGRLQLSVDRFPTLAHKLRRYVSLKEMERRLNHDEWTQTEVHRVDYAISAFWLLSREVYEQVGVLDERIFYAPEDVDYCIRVWKAGYPVLYDPSVQAVHAAQEISRGRPWRRIALKHAAGLIYLFTKHRYAFVAPDVSHRWGLIRQVGSNDQLAERRSGGAA